MTDTKLLILSERALFRKSEDPDAPFGLELIPGSAEAVTRSADEGYRLLIASNQEGCMPQNMCPRSVDSGYIYGSKIAGIIDGYDNVGGYSKFVLEDGRRIVARSNETVNVQLKSFDDVIAEMDHYLEALPEIGYALFCPWSDFGDDCWQYKPNGARMRWRDDCLISRPNHGACGSPTPRNVGCLKPNEGMILIAMTIAETFDALMVVSEPKDQQAAVAAGIPFINDCDWRDGK